MNKGRTVVDYLHQGERKVSLTVDQGETLIYVLIAGQAGEKEVEVELAAPGARADLLGLFIGTAGGMRVRTLQHHLAPQTTSELLFRSVMTDGAQLEYRGLIKIEKTAQNADAYQKNDNLLLSPKAHVDSRPELEILANEVRCTHGVTVGRLDEESLFYLMSRGLPATVARNLLLTGFTGEVLTKITDKKARAEVTQQINRMLAKLYV